MKRLEDDVRRLFQNPGHAKTLETQNQNTYLYPNKQPNQILHCDLPKRSQILTIITSMPSSNDSPDPTSVQGLRNRDLLTVSVQEFGPISQATVNLRPLTIFVGRSNTGKTYFSKLIYAIHKTFSGFPQIPFVGRYPFPISISEPTNLLLKRTDFEQQEIRKIISQYFAQSRHHMNDRLIEEIERCFGTPNILTTRRARSKIDHFKICVSYGKPSTEIWNISIGSKKNKTLTTARFNPNAVKFTNSSYEKLLIAIRQYDKLSSPISKEEFLDSFYFELGEFIHKLAYPNSRARQDSYFLPANRGGILESHKFVADAWLAQIPNLGLKHLPAMQPLPKISVDFIRTMLMFEDRTRSTVRKQKNSNVSPLESVANIIENELIYGKLRTSTSTGTAYPVFEFMPSHTKRSLKLDAASSMVSELAPIIVIARSHLNPFDLLIIEEPEAHLHPGALPLIAKCLARLVRNNVRVLITTHSDWLLKSLRNLILEGDLVDSKLSDQNVANDNYLLRNEVGAWEFSASSDLGGTTVDEIMFDEFDGIEPSEIERISDSLYNESVAIRNAKNFADRKSN